MKYLTYDGLALYDEKIKQVIGTKVDKETGKGLSTNDYTTTEKTKLAGIAEGANKYTLPVASASVSGGIKVGTNLTITNGVLSANAASYTLPTASASTLGGVKVGNNLTIASGVLSASVPTKTSQLTNDSTYQTLTQVNTLISTAVASAVTYKGTVDTYAQLPTSNKVGDLWNVASNGMNYVWDGTKWDAQAPTIDLSNYVQFSDLVAITNDEINALFV